ncbi:MAG: very short patch repair endonuclease [Verrucomicrobia bacterium]|nr:very short patch repair endonuclease [Verrucomicrobiota bacterium]
MPDVFTKAKRSEVMSRIRSRGNRDTELALAKLLRRHGITGWRRHALLRVTSDQWRVTRKNRRRTSPRPSPQRGEGVARAAVLSPVTRHLSLTVRPDFVFLKSRAVIFVDGCFWHGCPRHATKPKNNRAFWRRKLAANQARDALVTRTLRRTGWRVLRVWEHELARKNEARLRRRIQRALR